MNDRDGNPRLLDVVPWSYGFAHSWALSWLLAHDASSGVVLELLVPDASAPRTVVGDVQREQVVAGARADVALVMQDGDGRERSVAIEVKVADTMRRSQIDALAAHFDDVVVYLPGLSGLFYEPNGRFGEERWISGREIATALAHVALPEIIKSYLEDVRNEAERMEAALAAARMEVPEFAEEGRSPYKSLSDVAWLVTIARAIRRSSSADLEMRAEAHDRGIFWRDSFSQVPDCNGAGLYVDVVADVHVDRCAVVVKVGDGKLEDRRAARDLAVTAQPPTAAGWKAGRRGTGGTQTVWRLDASEMPADEAAAQAVAARDWIKAVTEPNPASQAP